MAQPVKFRASVASIQRHGANVSTYRLVAEKRLPRFIPGQFIHLTIEPYDGIGFWPESRIFSVANAVADRRTIMLTINRQGTYTSRILDELTEGRVVWGKGPYGEFTINKGPAVLIAGGTGITPFCAYMDTALNSNTLPLDKTVLFYGALRPDLLIYKQLTDACSERLPNFRSLYFAEQLDNGIESGIQQGLLSPKAVMEEAHDLIEPTFYLSGPLGMIKVFKTSLAENYGIPRQRIMIDAWS